MASSAAQNIPGSAHIQALHNKAHQKPAADKSAQGEKFADLLAENDASQPVKQAQPREKTARTEKTASTGEKKEAVPDAKEETAQDDVAEAREAEPKQEAQGDAEDKQEAANDNETPEGVAPQMAQADVQAKLKQTATSTPQDDTVGKSAGGKPEALADARAQTEAEEAAQTGTEAPEFEKALHEAKAEAPRTTETAAPKPVEMKPANDIAPAALGGSSPTQHNIAGTEKLTQTAQTPAAQPHHPTPDVNQFAVEVAARSQAGAKQFDIRLDPPELGRVDVRLSIDAAGKAEAHLTAESSQTLDLLQKDASVLARALRDAGLNLSQDGLNFSLKSQQQAGEQGRQQGQHGRNSMGAQPKEQEDVQASAYQRRSLGLLDIRI